MQVEVCNTRKAVRGETLFLWACLNKVTVLLGLSSLLTLYPVSSVSRKPAAYHRSFVKCVLVPRVTLSKKNATEKDKSSWSGMSVASLMLPGRKKK